MYFKYDKYHDILSKVAKKHGFPPPPPVEAVFEENEKIDFDLMRQRGVTRYKRGKDKGYIDDVPPELQYASTLSPECRQEMIDALKNK